jgi:oxygen-independent coproporphyrinogen-3 oxidase
MNISLYIHIPFCVKKCSYCDFYSVPYTTAIAGEFISALGKEWLLVKKECGLENNRVTTIFFGGGTPSILSLEQWEFLQKSLTRHLAVADDVEWTIECNPDSFSREKAGLWNFLGATRLTIGVQSIVDEELRVLGRPHSADQALSVINDPSLAKFKSIGIDLMYGVPLQTTASFDVSLNAALLAPFVRHLSVYELTICPNTPFGTIKGLPLPCEDTVYDMAKPLLSKCRERGFERYEISNFAQPGHRCRHNEAYWNHSPYIGLGPGAHSYIHPKRWANIADVKQYIATLKSGNRAIDFEETIDNAKLLSEVIFLRLRTASGLDETSFLKMTGEDFYSGKRRAVLDTLRRESLIIYEKSRWALTEDGMMIGDAINRKLL